MNFLKYNNWETIDINKLRYENYNLKNKNNEHKKSNIKPINNDKLAYITIYNNLKNKNKIEITTPEMVCLFGLQNYNNNYSISLQFTNYKTDKNMNLFYNFIKGVELNQIKHIGLDNDNINLYLSQIKLSDKYDPNLNIKIPFRYNKFEVECKNKEGEHVYLTNIPKFSKVRCDIYIDKIWIFNDNYICKWKLSKILIL